MPILQTSHIVAPHICRNSVYVAPLCEWILQTWSIEDPVTIVTLLVHDSILCLQSMNGVLNDVQHIFLQHVIYASGFIHVCVMYAG